MTWWASLGGLVVIGWVLCARAIMRHAVLLSELRERIAFLEAKVNGQPGGSHAKTP